MIMRSMSHKFFYFDIGSEASPNGQGKGKTMVFYIGFLAAALLWMGWCGWKVNRNVDRKIKRLEARRKSKEPRRKEREDGWAA